MIVKKCTKRGREKLKKPFLKALKLAENLF